MAPLRILRALRTGSIAVSWDAISWDAMGMLPRRMNYRCLDDGEAAKLFAPRTLV